MKGLFVVLLLVVVCVVGLGFYQGWFRFSKDAADDKVNVTLTVDQEKIKDDTQKAEKKVQDIGREAKERISPATNKVKD